MRILLCIDKCDVCGSVMGRLSVTALGWVGLVKCDGCGMKSPRRVFCTGKIFVTPYHALSIICAVLRGTNQSL